MKKFPSIFVAILLFLFAATDIQAEEVCVQEVQDVKEVQVDDLDITPQVNQPVLLNSFTYTSDHLIIKPNQLLTVGVKLPTKASLTTGRAEVEDWYNYDAFGVIRKTDTAYLPPGNASPIFIT